MRWAVVHEVRVGQRVVRQVRQVINDVPEKTDSGAVIAALESAGLAGNFMEGGVKWGNHKVVAEAKLPAGTENFDVAPTAMWSELLAPEGIRRITLRLTAADYDLIRLAAARLQVTRQQFCEQALVTDANRVLEQAAAPPKKPRRRSPRPPVAETAPESATSENASR